MHFLKSILNGIDHTINFGKGLLAFIVIAPFAALIWKKVVLAVFCVIFAYCYLKFCYKLHDKYFPDNDKKLIMKIEKFFHKLNEKIEAADMKALNKK